MPASRAKPNASPSISPPTRRGARIAAATASTSSRLGREPPLCAGVVDDLEAAGIKAFGPSCAAARLEGSKGFTKDLCRSAGIPTAAYERFRAAEPAKAYIREHGVPIVVKAD